MPANFTIFEQSLTAYWSKPPPNITTEISAAFLTALYVGATLPAQTQFGNFIIVPKPKILYTGFLMTFKDNLKQGHKGLPNSPAQFIPLAKALVQYWLTIPMFPEFGGNGVVFNPMPAALPTVAPVPLGAFIKQKDLDDAVDLLDPADPDIRNMKQTGGLPMIQKSLKTNAFNLDPLILMPSPFVLFSGLAQLLAVELYNAIGIQNKSASDAAHKFTNVLKNQLTLVSGFYIGFMPPGSVPPIAIVPWSGLT